MTQAQLTKRVSDKLLGKMKKYTHVIRMKSGREITIETDYQLSWDYDSTLRAVTVKTGYDGTGLHARAEDVDYWFTEKHETE